MNRHPIDPTRRRLLGMAAAAPLAALGPVRAASAEELPLVTLRASAADQALMTDAPNSPLWLYNGELPGPTLHLRQGEPFSVRFINDTGEPSSMHWHGLRIANAMDGAAGLTQKPVPPGESFDYRFVPPDAGTFWFHPHGKSWQALARGLYGALIVEERNPPAVDDDQVLLLDDWSLDENGVLIESFGNLHDASHSGRLGNWLTVNGVYPLEQTV
ncbi:MAG: multicopper oxidase domain-containing protein, partial [Granulosicoccaceae bacterium]